ncbi:Cadmium-induced protein [Actinidia chinensis var. chinensis]|uniref:Cadmium-induced protein n=1 Tax=Actinidia chinensis var. chinensis TaxID=1590841 RepID=A0A2R6PHK4_ACTCC|nr:Cadmium-induced protein [Actinidia chinensis var. chinensis]
MIIKGLFRRYERWNPVHPTSGAFWGMGIGVGCGVGWGPGFGPEVIGYVGAGCGVGFSVGITLAGIGIGLPANYVFEVPYNALMATRSGALDIARSSGLLSLKNVSASGWSNIVPNITDVQTKVLERFSSLKHKDSCNEMVDLSEMRSIMSTHTRSILDNLRNFGARFSDRHKGLKD